MRLGVYTDLVFFRSGAQLTTDRAYVRFVLGLAERVDELVLFGRSAPGEQPKPYVVCPQAGVRCVEHGTDIDEATARLMRDRDVALVPTFAVV